MAEYVQIVTNIAQQVRRLFAKQKHGYYSRHFSFRFDCNTAPAEYRWDGSHRTERRNYHWLVLQITTRGRGVFEWRGRRHVMKPGLAFCAYIPSEHCYYLPKDSEEWEFVWFSLQHVPRIAGLRELLARHRGVFAVEDAPLLVQRTMDLMALALKGGIADEFEEEWHATMWAFELERLLRSQLFPQQEKHGLQARLAALVRAGEAAVTIEEAARQFGMSRAHFSRVFKRGTGESPAAYLLKLRLQLVAERLHQSGDKLDYIASEEGFRDASELCRAFRRVYGVSPAVFRSQFALGRG